MDSAHDFANLLWIVLAVACGPVLARLTRGWVPDTVWLLLLGIVLGPPVLGLMGHGDSIGLISDLGLGLLFLLAGFELEPSVMRTRQGRWSWIVWVVSLGLAVALAALIARDLDVFALVAIGLALTSTALGTLLPILKSAGAGSTPVGRGVLVHGAVGELGPVIVIALLLSGRSFSLSALVLVMFVVITAIGVVLPLRVLRTVPVVRRIMLHGASGTSQTVLRTVMLILVALMLLSAVLDLDVVLGAFTAGMLIKAMTPPRAVPHLMSGLESLSYSIFIPVFFVHSGMGISLSAVADSPLVLLAFFVAILALRGGPIMLGEAFIHITPGVHGARESIRMGLYGATGLPIIVAVTALATSNDLLSKDLGSLLVLAGACTVLVFPALANLLAPAAAEAPASPEERG